MNESIAILANDPSKKLLFDFLSNDQPGKLISSALSFNTFPEDDQNQPGHEGANAKSAKEISRKMFMGIDQDTTISEEASREVKVKKLKKPTALTKEEFFSDFLVDLFCVDSGSNS